MSPAANDNGELGRRKDDRAAAHQPGLVTRLNVPIAQLACGGYHSAALDRDGRVWTWGHGGHGQLGHGSLASGEPAVVQALQNVKVVAVACGGAWTAAVTDDGRLWTWGKGRDHQLGVAGARDVEATPQLVTFEPPEGEAVSSNPHPPLAPPRPTQEGLGPLSTW
eukprot:SM000190S04855  [mRNA]  locus=s190:46523:47299:- [translate_table: standard]